MNVTYVIIIKNLMGMLHKDWLVWRKEKVTIEMSINLKI